MGLVTLATIVNAWHAGYLLPLCAAVSVHIRRSRVMTVFSTHISRYLCIASRFVVSRAFYSGRMLTFFTAVDRQVLCEDLFEGTWTLYPAWSWRRSLSVSRETQFEICRWRY